MFISKKKLRKVLREIESEFADQTKITGDTQEERIRNSYFRSGNANAANYVAGKLLK